MGGEIVSAVFACPGGVTKQPRDNKSVIKTHNWLYHQGLVSKSTKAD